MLDGKEWRKLPDAIPAATLRDLRDRALIATLTNSFAQIGTALKISVEDLRSKRAGWELRLHQKGGKYHVMPCHHALAEALRAYIDDAGIAEDRKGFLFRTSRGHRGVALSEEPMGQSDAWRMIRKRAGVVGIFAPIGNHPFRATGITAYLRTAAPTNMRRRWQRTKARERRSSTTGRRSRLLLMRSKESDFRCGCRSHSHQLDRV